MFPSILEHTYTFDSVFKMKALRAILLCAPMFFKNVTNPRNQFYFRCSICHYSYASEYEMTVHLASHFEKEMLAKNRGIESRCHPCQKTYREKRVLLRHIAFNHNHLNTVCSQKIIDVSLTPITKPY